MGVAQQCHDASNPEEAAAVLENAAQQFPDGPLMLQRMGQPRYATASVGCRRGSAALPARTVLEAAKSPCAIAQASDWEPIRQTGSTGTDEACRAACRM